jgi:hypothetical protein
MGFVFSGYLVLVGDSWFCCLGPMGFLLRGETFVRGIKDRSCDVGVLHKREAFSVKICANLCNLWLAWPVVNNCPYDYTSYAINMQPHLNTFASLTLKHY